MADYGLLDDFVTAITETVPELLNRRQRCLLSLGLRAQVLYEEGILNIEPLSYSLQHLLSILCKTEALQLVFFLGFS